MEELELRMYFFVPYQLTGIQQGIQCGHAALEYANRFRDTELFQKFITYYKTWIVLNGGTTNNGMTSSAPGTLNDIYSSIIHYNIYARLDDKIDVEKFYEPDLNDALTSVCVICDARVFDKEHYPNFGDWRIDFKMYDTAKKSLPKLNENMLRKLTNDNAKELFPEYFQDWVNFIGGPKNLFLRDLINGKKLA